MSATQGLVINTQVAVKYQQNVSSLLIGMSADNWTTTLSQHIHEHIGRVLVEMSTHAQPICWLICRPAHLGWQSNRHSTDMSADISVDTQPICWPIHWSSVGWYDNQYIGQGVHKIHTIPITCSGLHFWHHFDVIGYMAKLLKSSVQVIRQSSFQILVISFL